MLHHKLSTNHAAASSLPRISAWRAAGFGAAIALANLVGLPAAATPRETVLYAFKGGTDGAVPLAGLVLDAGALYGTTFSGGGGKCPDYGGCGTVFELTRPAAGKTRWIETVLHRFGRGADGQNPEAGLIMDENGDLYGTTALGGDACRGGCGTVFELVPPAVGETRWTETVLYAFIGGAFADGRSPGAGVIMGANGALYGTTTNGGGHAVCPSEPPGCGTVFELTPPAAGETRWTENVLYRFKHGPDGANPGAGLIADANGALYGTTSLGGRGATCFLCGSGTVFELVPPATGKSRWTETTLHGFTGGADGAHPEAGLIMDANGALYGTTTGDCPRCFGTVFTLTPPAAGKTRWTEKVLYAFKGGADGAKPQAGLIMDANDDLYGTTAAGGSEGEGTIFELMPPAAGTGAWTEKVLYSFKGGTDGANPNAGLIMAANGALYGTTANGGGRGCRGSGCGTVFKLVP